MSNAVSEELVEKARDAYDDAAGSMTEWCEIEYMRAALTAIAPRLRAEGLSAKPCDPRECICDPDDDPPMECPLGYVPPMSREALIAELERAIAEGAGELAENCLIYISTHPKEPQP